MANQTSPASRYLYYTKYVGLALTLLGIPLILLDKSQGSDIPLLVGLFTLLVTTEKVQDERSVQIKTTSLYISFVVSYALKLMTTNLHQHDLISFELVEINHFLILTLAIANGIFYSRMYILKY